MSAADGHPGHDKGGIAVDERADGGTRSDEGFVDEAPQPVPEGFWMTILGCFVAVMAPLIGFLGGSISGAGNDPTGRRLALWLTIGLIIGGLGILSAFVGALKWWRATHA